MSELGTLPEFSLLVWCIVVVSAFVAALIHGATGMIGGILMTAIMSQIIGVKAAIPVMTCALIFSHASRVVLYWRETDRAIAKRVLLFGTPTLILGAYVFSYLNENVIALSYASFLLVCMPVKHWAAKNKIQTSPTMLATASTFWGFLAGNVVGPGLFLSPFLLGTGMNRLTFVGTLAIITFLMNVIKLTVFSGTQVFDTSLLLLGIIIGLLSIPGNWLGKKLLVKLSDRAHRLILDGFTLAMIANFVMLGVQG